MYSLLGQWDKALIEIQNFLELKKKNNITDLNSKFHQICREAYLEINLFKEAIDALSNAIEKDPENKRLISYELLLTLKMEVLTRLLMITSILKMEILYLSLHLLRKNLQKH